MKIVVAFDLFRGSLPAQEGDEIVRDVLFYTDGHLQRCWIHFARDIHEERLITPNDSFLETLHDKTQFIMDSAKVLLAGSVSAAKTKKL